MKKYFLTIKNHLFDSKVIFVYFCIYFFIGLLIYADYGMNWDDTAQRKIGLMNVDYLTGDKGKLIESLDKYHGPAFEILLVGLEKKFKVHEFAELYKLRHLAVFCYFFISAICFFLATKIIYKENKIALIATLFFVLSPRIFGESFYNPKDITLLSSMIIAVYTGLLFCFRPTFWYALLVGFCVAFSYNIRILGILTLPFIGLWFIYLHRKKTLRYWLQIIVAFIAFFVTFLFTSPIYFEGIVFHVTEAYKQLSHFSIWDGYNLYFGQLISALSITGAYQLVWFVITTPAFYLLLFIIGVLFLLIAKKDFVFLFTLSCFVLFATPIAMMWIKKSVVYDGWRHVYCIYPFFIWVAAFGYYYLYQSLPSNGRVGLSIFLSAYFVYAIITMVRFHPFQFAYFNPVANAIYGPMEKQFEIDYWGVSYKQGFEYLYKKAEAEQKHYLVYVHCAPAIDNYNFLQKKIGDRITITNDNPDVDYFLDFGRPTNAIPFPTDQLEVADKLYCQKNVIMTIYKKKK